MSIREICNRSVVCATSDTTAVDAAKLMRQHHIGNVVVVDRQDGDRTPLGVVTDRDLVVEVVAAGLDPAVLKLGDLLVGRLVTAEESTSYAETIRIMALHGVRRLPVVQRLRLSRGHRQRGRPAAATRVAAGRAGGSRRAQPALRDADAEVGARQAPPGALSGGRAGAAYHWSFGTTFGCSGSPS